MVAHGVRFKAEDIWDAPEDGNVYEVIDGELYVTPAPAWRCMNSATSRCDCSAIRAIARDSSTGSGNFMSGAC